MRYQVLSPEEVARELAGEKRPFLLDVRPLGDYERGHLPGAHNVPVHDMGRRQPDLPHVKIARIIVIGEPGQRTVAAANFLALMGYADVAVLDGGLGAWTGALESGPPPAPPPRGPELRVIKDDVKGDITGGIEDDVKE